MNINVEVVKTLMIIHGKQKYIKDLEAIEKICKDMNVDISFNKRKVE